MKKTGVCFRYISVQKCLCLVGVIVFHAALPFAGPNPFWKVYAKESSPVAALLSTYLGMGAVPSFFFGAGFLLCRAMIGANRGRLAQLANRAQRLLLPWFLLAMLWLVPLYTFLDIPAYNRAAGLGLIPCYLAALSGVFSDHAWYLLVLFWSSAFWIVFLPVFLKAKNAAIGQIAGLFFAVGASLIIQEYGQSLTWWNFRQIAGPLIYFYLGCLCFVHREIMMRILSGNALVWMILLALLYALLGIYAYSHYAMLWFSGVIGCFLTLAAGLFLCRPFFSPLLNSAPVRYFEKNSFRYYLFHMPLAILSFQLLYPRLRMPPVCLMLASFILTMAATTIVVAISRLAYSPRAD